MIIVVALFVVSNFFSGGYFLALRHSPPCSKRYHSHSAVAVVHLPMHFQFLPYFIGAVQAKLNMKLLQGMISLCAKRYNTTENGKSQMTAVGIITSGNINFLTNE